VNAIHRGLEPLDHRPNVICPRWNLQVKSFLHLHQPVSALLEADATNSGQ
jgi:hypothetical protein